MNEELKIIVKAVTDSAKKGIKDVNKELGGLGKASKAASNVVGAAMKTIGKSALAVVGVIAAVGTALVALGKSTLEFSKEQAKLQTAFQASGASAAQATKTYKDFYRFLGDSGKATEAAAHLAKITTNQQDLAQWTSICQGIYATFGDSLPIEGLTEAANETIRVGQVTGTLADALNWAGVSEDEFNAKLAATSSLEEREALLRSTLNGLYDDAARIYEENNRALLEYNESQANLDIVMAEAGRAVLPLMTSLNNLSATLFTALSPAINAVVPIIAGFVDILAKAVQWVVAFFSALTGSKASVKVVGDSVKSVGSGIKSATSGANNLASGMEDAAGAAAEAKKSTQGFDELNIVSSGNSGGGSSSSGSPAYASGGGGASPVGESVAAEMEEGESSAESFAEKIKKVFGDVANTLTTIFNPTIDAWCGAFDTVKQAWNNAKPDFTSGAQEILTSFSTLGTYLLNSFIPDVINSFSTNLAPVIGDVLGFAIEEGGKHFEWFGGVVNTQTNDIILPALGFIKNTTTDTFQILGEAWNKHGAPLLEQLSLAFENLRENFDNLYSNVIKPIWDKILEVLNYVWTEGLKPLTENFVESCLVIGEELLILYNKFIAPVVNWILKNIYPIIVKVWSKVIEIIGDFVKHISDAISGAITTIKGIVQFIVGIFTLDWEKAWEGIKNIFGGVWETIKGLALAAWDSIRLTFEPIGEFFSGCWDKITEAFSNIKDWFKQKFEEAWTAIKNVFSGVGTFFGGIWNTIKEKFTTLGTNIGNAISDSVKSGINGVISLIEKTINKAIRLINGGIDLINLIPGVTVGKVKELSLPRLAKGGVVDSATIAMIGEAGKEAVVPLENNTEWMNLLADKIASRSNTPSKIVLMLDGRELGWASIGAINNITRQTGSLQLKLI